MTVSEDGMNALVTLAKGDMRRSLNILQVGLIFERWIRGLRYAFNPNLFWLGVMKYEKKKREKEGREKYVHTAGLGIELRTFHMLGEIS